MFLEGALRLLDVRRREEYPLPRRIAGHFCAHCFFNIDVENRRVTGHKADDAYPSKSPVH